MAGRDDALRACAHVTRLVGRPGTSCSKPRDADCLAGTWAHSVFEQGLLAPDDLEEATNAALAVGDFDVGNAQHHGTPEERRDALLTGYDTGEPAQCNRFVATA
ncbi:MAG: neutral zinc metallopeptidase [Actinobacteria bacterium]|nr:neutral zinc metallopeptidase [Actinomycetota bacterium]